MKRKILITLSLVFNFFASVLAADIPRIAYMGPVVSQVSAQEYADIKMCGFTNCINIYNTLEEAKSDLKRAYRAGIGLYIHTPQVVQTPARAASYLGGQNGLSGYFLADEPSYASLQTIKKNKESIAKVDSKHPCVVNLHPYYDEKQFRNIGSQTYRQYLQAAIDLGMPQISFDYYPVTKSGLRDGWFGNLSEVRSLCKNTGLSFWGFILTVPHGEYPQPMLASLRLQAYVNLLYGAKALVYFTYKTPSDKNYDFHDAPVNADGKKTKTYYLAKTLNAELKTISTLFAKAVISRVGHLVKIPYGEQKAVCPKQLDSLVVEGKKGALVSEFTSGKNRYLAVVNKDYTDSMRLRIKAKTQSVCYINKKLQQEKLAGQYIVQPGDVVIFKLK